MIHNDYSIEKLNNWQDSLMRCICLLDNKKIHAQFQAKNMRMFKKRWEKKHTVTNSNKYSAINGACYAITFDTEATKLSNQKFYTLFFTVYTLYDVNGKNTQQVKCAGLTQSFISYDEPSVNFFEKYVESSEKTSPAIIEDIRLCSLETLYDVFNRYSIHIEIKDIELSAKISEPTISNITYYSVILYNKYNGSDFKNIRRLLLQNAATLLNSIIEHDKFDMLYNTIRLSREYVASKQYITDVEDLYYRIDYILTQLYTVTDDNDLDFFLNIMLALRTDEFLYNNPVEEISMDTDVIFTFQTSFIKTLARTKTTVQNIVFNFEQDNEIININEFIIDMFDSITKNLDFIIEQINKIKEKKFKNINISQELVQVDSLCQLINKDNYKNVIEYCNGVRVRQALAIDHIMYAKSLTNNHSLFVKIFNNDYEFMKLYKESLKKTDNYFQKYSETPVETAKVFYNKIIKDCENFSTETAQTFFNDTIENINERMILPVLFMLYKLSQNNNDDSARILDDYITGMENDMIDVLHKESYNRINHLVKNSDEFVKIPVSVWDDLS